MKVVANSRIRSQVASLIDQHAIHAFTDEIAHQAQRQRGPRGPASRRAPSAPWRPAPPQARRNSMSARSASGAAPSAAVRTMYPPRRPRRRSIAPPRAAAVAHPRSQCAPNADAMSERHMDEVARWDRDERSQSRTLGAERILEHRTRMSAPSLTSSRMRRCGAPSHRSPHRRAGRCRRRAETPYARDRRR